ncbi:E3 ubiquitin-protein ligase MPSR1-like [Curcuma longa]|uniref:E3 ubiquitin-protein ligase MPSR1-like n=1 Tax=Curcuma longa TaxID=136217 RepID=UPI003D9E5F61
MAAQEEESLAAATAEDGLERLIRNALSEGEEGRPPRFVQLILGVTGSPPQEAAEDSQPADRIVLFNPVTQGMVVLRGDAALVAELLSESSVGGGPPPASKASIEAMRTVRDVLGEEEECPVCLDGLGGGGDEADAVREMPCRHRFHEGCIVKWLGIRGSCPVCRFRMPAEDDAGSKMVGGEGRGEAEGNEVERSRRRRGLWVTIIYSGSRRSRRSDLDLPSSSSPETSEDGGGGGGRDGGVGAM